MKLDRRFFAQPADKLAPLLLGTIVVRHIGRSIRRARVVETEAYLGPRDLASHASKGRTLRTEMLFGPPGRAYVYFVYGLHWMFNVVCGSTGEAHAVLLRAAEPLDHWHVDLTGPAKLARAMGITRVDNGLDLTGDKLYFQSEPKYQPRVVSTKRVGIEYAKHWKNRHLRFIDKANPVANKLRF